MARRRLQYQALAKTLFVPVAIVAAPVGGCFTSFSQPAPHATQYPAHQQPQPSFEIGFLGPASNPGQLVFSAFSQPPSINKVAPWLQPSPSYGINYPGPANTSDRLIFATFSQPRFSTVYRVEQQPQPNYQIGYFGALQPLVFSTFSQPPPNSKVAVEQQPQPTFTILLGPANVPPWFTFSPFEQPRFGPVTQSVETASAIFEVAFPPQQTLVFSLFSQPRFGPVAQGIETASALFEVAFPPQQTLVFATFSQPRFSTTIPAQFQPQPWQQYGPPIYPIPGGTSRKLPGDRKKTGLLPLERRPTVPTPAARKLPIPPVDVVSTRVETAGTPPTPHISPAAVNAVSDIAFQIMDAQDATDIEAFLKGSEQDEQDAADIADILRLLG